MKLRTSAKTLAIAMALTLGVAATAFAVATPDDGHCGPGHSMGRGMEHGMARGMKEMSKLHGDLKLDEKQEALWLEAEKGNKDTMSGMRGQMQKQRATALATLNEPGADLRAVLKQMDEARAAGQKQHEASRERWLTVYDSLNAGQKEKARLFFKTKLEHMGQFSGASTGKAGQE